MAAWCAAAGREYNEDNFLLKDNLSSPEWGRVNTDEVVSLDEKGALLVVCDGMGGMNAGEVASELAVKTIQEQFAAELLTPQIMATPKMMMDYIDKAINAADEIIKEDGKRNRGHEGMGSTIVLAWVAGKNIYVGWCGDSRAYRYNPAFGLEQLSHDHSYVQELVDEGKLTAELAFDHPNNNIVTRSLGDFNKKFRPDTACFPLYNGDVILLCSDGLNGVLRDGEIRDIIAENSATMEKCRKALWSESEKAGWTDNVTITLCQIVSGANPAPENMKTDMENLFISQRKQNKLPDADNKDTTIKVSTESTQVKSGTVGYINPLRFSTENARSKYGRGRYIHTATVAAALVLGMLFYIYTRQQEISPTEAPNKASDFFTPEETETTKKTTYDENVTSQKKRDIEAQAREEAAKKAELDELNILRKKAEQGDATAQNNLGYRYEHGRNVQPSDTEAVYWYRKSAEQGNADAQSNLGNIFANGRSVPQSETETAYWYRKLAEQGDAISQYNLGYMYLTGRGVPQNDTEAVNWFRKAAEQGDAIAQNNLGYMYETGRGVQPSDTEAAYWYRKSADQGNANSEHNLSIMYKTGRVIP